MRAGIGAVGDAVAVHVEVAAEIACRLPAPRPSSPCRGPCGGCRPRRTARHSRSFMPMSRSSMHEDRRLQPVGEVERQRAELEAFVRVFAGTAARAWCRRARRRRRSACRTAGCASACRWTGRRAARRRSPPGFRRNRRGPRNSCISEMPGPEVAVKARAPFQPAPITMPIEASSSSAWTIAKRALPVVRVDAVAARSSA